MKFKVILDFSGDMEEDNIEEYTELAKYCLEEGAETFHCSVVVEKIEAIEEDSD